MPSTSQETKYVFLIAMPTVARNGALPDLTPLSQHGDVKVLVPAGDSPTFSPVKIAEQIAGRLKDFDPDTDFLVWAGGDTLAAVVVGLVLATKEIFAFNWLRFERGKNSVGQRTTEGGRYVPVRIDLNNTTFALDFLDDDSWDDEDDDLDDEFEEGVEYEETDDERP